MDKRMSIPTRQKLSWFLGGATNIIVLKSKSKPGPLNTTQRLA